MKKLMYLFIILFITACSEQKQFSITGSISNYADDLVYLNKIQDGELITIDTTSSHNGNFSFKGTIDAPEMYYITIKGTSNELPFFIDNSKISIIATSEHLQEGVISGSPAHDEYFNFSITENKYTEQLDSIYYLYNTAEEEGDNDKLAQLDDSYDLINIQKKEFIRDYILQQDKSFISPFLLYKKLIYDINLKELDSITNNFDPSLNKSPYIKLLNERIAIFKRVDIGQPYVEIELNDTSGNPIALSSLVGNYILIDFWASWCPPCRAENPNVVELYSKFKEKGFEIYGVSLDSKKSKWIKGISEDEITYTQVSELKGWKCSTAKQYGVNSIPHTVLLNRNGIIIDKDIRGERLADKIAELLNE